MVPDLVRFSVFSLSQVIYFRILYRGIDIGKLRWWRLEGEPRTPLTSPREKLYLPVNLDKEWGKETVMEWRRKVAECVCMVLERLRGVTEGGTAHLVSFNFVQCMFLSIFPAVISSIFF